MLAIDVETGAHCAVKSIQHAGTKTEYLANELEIIRASAKQQHPCIVRFLAAVQEPGQTHFVLERAAGGSVQDLHMAQNQLPEYLVQAIARDVLRGLEFVHSLGFVHRGMCCGASEITAALCAVVGATVCQPGLAHPFSLLHGTCAAPRHALPPRYQTCEHPNQPLARAGPSVNIQQIQLHAHCHCAQLGLSVHA